MTMPETLESEYGTLTLHHGPVLDHYQDTVAWYAYAYDTHDIRYVIRWPWRVDAPPDWT